MATEDALESRSRKVNIVAVDSDTVKEVLQGGVDLKQNVDDVTMMNTKGRIKKYTAVAATATIYGGISRSFRCSSLDEA